ncbi:RICIN domain-containing protein [Mucilaginibacter xinganensis]|nr:RICIN domain-containing protein [Mucilaginibacter xinganensis]
MKKPSGLFCFCLMLMMSFLASAQTIKGNYAIKNVQTGMLLRVKDAHAENGTPLVSYYPENWKCMTWNFKHITGNTYQLQNLLTNKTFQPVGEPGSGVNLEEQPLNPNGGGQQYEFEPVDTNTFMIKLKGTDLFLTADKKGSVNSRVVLTKKGNSKEQYWTIYEQVPTM